MSPDVHCCCRIVSVLSFACVVAPALATEPTLGAKFDSGGVSLHYSVSGKGEPVLLIHGLHSSAMINWRFPGTVAALEKKYQVIAMDVRGHGQSGKPEEESKYGVELAEDAVRLLDHLKIDKAHLVGYSMGGMIAMKVTVDHPDRVRSTTLGGMGWLQEGSGLQKFWEKLPAKKRTTSSACAKTLGKLAVSAAEVKAIRCPVSVVIGEKDICKALYVEPLRKLRPDWPIAEIAGAGHITCIFQPEFKTELLKALETHSKK